MINVFLISGANQKLLHVKLIFLKKFQKAL